MKHSHAARALFACVLTAFVAVTGAAGADETESLLGAWFGERNGYEVMWRFEAAGRMRLEDRGATWTVRNDSLFVDFDAFGETEMTERAVYRFLLSSPQYLPRRMFVLGFDLGQHGLLLTREEAPPVEPDVDRPPAPDPPPPDARDDLDAPERP